MTQNHALIAAASGLLLAVAGAEGQTSTGTQNLVPRESLATDGQRIRGSVTDVQTGKLPRHVRLTLRARTSPLPDGRAWIRVHVSREGEILCPLLAQGAYTFVVEAPNYDAQKHLVDLSAAKQEAIHIRLEPWPVTCDRRNRCKYVADNGARPASLLVWVEIRRPPADITVTRSLAKPYSVRWLNPATGATVKRELASGGQPFTTAYDKAGEYLLTIEAQQPEKD